MTWEEWQALGETRHFEWSEGVLYVNPPNRWHVIVGKKLSRLLDDVAPEGLIAYPEWGLRTAAGDFEPDIMLAAADQPDGEHYSVATPLLVVEIGSPTTRDLDWDRKLHAYAAAGVGWYWIVDRATVVVLENAGGTFVERQRIEAGAPQATVGPVSLELDPGTLADR
ncbi:MAG: Uma2 family endonuclease [Sporichthyaceae bacterium]